MDVLVDTNVLIRRIHRRDSKHRLAYRSLSRLVADGKRLCVTSQNLIEAWTVCTRPVANNGLGLDTALTDRILARVERSVTRLPDSDNVFREWRRLVVLNAVVGKKTHDAHLVAAMNVHGITEVLTFNTDDFARFSGIVAIHPKSLAPEQEYE
jgi:predicted nucleic acid-binding protein